MKVAVRPALERSPCHRARWPSRTRAPEETTAPDGSGPSCTDRRTGFDDAELADHLEAGTTFRDFFDQSHLNPHASLITGVICGVRVEDIEDPLMQRIRYLDKLVDELARGKAMEKVLRTA